MVASRGLMRREEICESSWLRVDAPGVVGERAAKLGSRAAIKRSHCEVRPPGVERGVMGAESRGAGNVLSLARGGWVLASILACSNLFS